MHTPHTTTDKIHLTKKGFKDLKKAIAELEHEHTRVLNELRDLDKTASHEQRLLRNDKLSVIDALSDEISEKRALLSRAILLPRKRDALKVAIGSAVELIDMQGRLVRYTIVDGLEANPSDGRISANSPLGQNLLGKQIRDIVEWTVGFRENRLTLVNIG